ncbi:citrate lyase [Fervidicella metallireducens AeB]|uniref:Citrate lyase n=1 Tax=Fervidicella metallireducens AeB TaxID=1403537 RepID=A0A017RW46_9CLOT|nr:aldolase/citrate lyase family protein [Fervidicella metallireducens]EYE88988.1 citrate lyase [Fervidicella metallireducens AeB]
MERLRRTMLFMPGNNPSMLQNAGILGADSVILDLEDAVSLTEKDSARILVRNAIKSVNFYNSEVVVRINPLGTEFGYEDLDVIGRVKPDAIMVPKATEADIKSVSEKLDKIEEEEGFEKGSIKLFALIESAYGLENVYSILQSSDRIIGMLLGAEDLTADLGIKRTREGEEIFYARSRVATACKACKVAAIDTPFADMEDMEGFIKDITRAKSLGMTGKAAINPRQIDTIHGVYAPTEAEIRYAQRVMEAQEEAKREGKGVFSLDGKMVDAPIIARAQTTLNTARLAGLI